MPVELAGLITDLAAETAALDALLEPLTTAQWRQPTPAAGWTVTDQVSHLAFFDGSALLAATDPDRFRGEAAELMAGGMDFPDRVAAAHRHLDGAALLSWFRQARADLLAGFATLDPKARLPWFGPDMGPASSLTARLMETWAHGQDVADTLGVQRAPSARLRHVADLGVRARPFSFAAHRLDVPSAPIRVELAAPDGARWTWGPDGAGDRITGDALEFCLLVTQRRHRAETRLAIEGPDATAWMQIAQAFAGAPGPGRPAPAEA